MNISENIKPVIRKNHLMKVKVLFGGCTDMEEEERQRLIHTHLHVEGKPIFGSCTLEQPHLRENILVSAIDFMIVGCSEPNLKEPFMVLIDHWSDIEEEPNLDFDAVKISFVKSLHTGNIPGELLKPSYAIAAYSQTIRTAPTW